MLLVQMKLMPVCTKLMDLQTKTAKWARLQYELLSFILQIRVKQCKLGYSANPLFQYSNREYFAKQEMD